MSNDQRPSGRFVLRIDPGLHGALRAAAGSAGISLNEYCSRKLATPGALPSPAAAAAVQAAARVVGERLMGVVAFGSWARDEAGPGSDVDLLVVLGSSDTINRQIYRDWDVAPASWDGREIEPHFVSLPKSSDRLSGIWAEAAIDGVVLFDRDMTVSRHLAAVRRDIASGRIIRRIVNGEPYWVEAA